MRLVYSRALKRGQRIWPFFGANRALAQAAFHLMEQPMEGI